MAQDVARRLPARLSGRRTWGIALAIVLVPLLPNAAGTAQADDLCVVAQQLVDLGQPKQGLEVIKTAQTYAEPSLCAEATREAYKRIRDAEDEIADTVKLLQENPHVQPTDIALHVRRARALNRDVSVPEAVLAASIPKTAAQAKEEAWATYLKDWAVPAGKIAATVLVILAGLVFLSRLLMLIPRIALAKIDRRRRFGFGIAAGVATVATLLVVLLLQPKSLTLAALTLLLGVAATVFTARYLASRTRISIESKSAGESAEPSLNLS